MEKQTNNTKKNSFFSNPVATIAGIGIGAFAAIHQVGTWIAAHVNSALFPDAFSGNAAQKKQDEDIGRALKDKNTVLGKAYHQALDTEEAKIPGKLVLTTFMEDKPTITVEKISKLTAENVPLSEKITMKNLHFGIFTKAWVGAVFVGASVLSTSLIDKLISRLNGKKSPRMER